MLLPSPLFPIICVIAQLSLRSLARMAGFGNNHMRGKEIARAKKSATTIQQLLDDKSVAGKFAPRKDKLAGDPIWTEAFHHFMALKKDQSFRCTIVKTERFKDTDGRWV